MVCALLSGFHGPAVESSFNVMGDIIDVEFANTTVQTYASYQAVKYHLKSANKNAVSYFQKEDFEKDSIDKKLLNSMTNSKQVYLADKEKSQKDMDERRKHWEAQKHNAACKHKVKEMATKLVKKACLGHNKKMMKVALVKK